MFSCLFGEVVSYLFYSKPPTEVSRWFHPKHISLQVTKRRRTGKETPAQFFPVKFAEFFRTSFSKNTFGGYF